MLALCMLHAALAAQERVPKPAAVQPIVLDITALVTGRVVDAENPVTKKSERKPVDRQLVWTVAKARFKTLKSLASRLDRLTANPASMRPDPKTGGKILPPLQINPGPNVRWVEVIQTFDKAMAAGFRKAAFGGVDTTFVVPVAIANAIVDKLDLTIPSCGYCDQDAGAPKLRLSIELHRDGRVVAGGRCVFERKTGEPKSMELLRQELRMMRAKMKAADKLSDRPGKDGMWVDMPILIQIDGEAQWRDVLSLLSELTKPEFGFWKHQFAVAEKSSRLR